MGKQVVTPRTPDLLTAAKALASFAGNQLTSRIAALEPRFAGARCSETRELLQAEAVSRELLASAYTLKQVAGQINVAIHAIGILLCLARLLEREERVEYLSLGAGNTGRAFDLETNLRVAEFKFIHWQGGSEVIRQNALFKDLNLLAEHQTGKRKHMYVLGTTHPLRFLRGGRALHSVMSRNRRLWDSFQARYGSRFKTVGDYFTFRQDAVILEDISHLVPELTTSHMNAADEEI